MKPDHQKELGALEIAFTLGYVIVLPLVGGTILGAYLDKKFGTGPLLLFIGVIAAIALSSTLLVAKFKKYIG